MPSPTPSALDELAAGLRARAARRAGTGVVAIDGWSGSGKTSLADRLAPALGAPCVHLDDFVPGWDGLARSVDLLVQWVLEPLAAGRPARLGIWDWTGGEWGAWRTLPPAELVLVEGCGSGAAAARPWLAALAWLDVDAASRRRRLEARPDWPGYAPFADRWSAQEEALRAGDDPAALADAVIRWPAGDREAFDDFAVSWRPVTPTRSCRAAST
ncbi:MAG TPA: hypothetical protein VKV06_15630 [Acidimicrobiales bacterium]|nr:hypothetical protein [Acidimicrobiales bacterium]